MNARSTDTRLPLIHDPPGGIFIWMLVALELLTFGSALTAFLFSAMAQPELFHESRLLLDPRFGIANTVFLLTSGCFMAETLRHFRAGNLGHSRITLLLTLAGGLLFLILKIVEYSAKIEHGHTLGSDPFFTWYWLLTIFHLMHVVVGMVILTCMLAKLPRLAADDLEAGGIFWHMCDIIWLLLFPALYLIL